ncbi:conserved hypothetical protein [Neospora caninum Liverpool]|uniref:Uncharacterized protein n=1 Tax=Neospora caninum (strain Liverpool) TaxID=572307 RepID=F0VA28_NEOCL|nr:conserved hypothetical protein [Neospora caninum Liverpool]CBZ50517.1 conserved hypothetical protein [Neospora caninum Liverpool]CEL65127.1 TPA: hypothetical protein BN1204_009860 [Neospora caninum Liverpool]|eukprot:XP_003880550.1 conserved hypothetical protein [Neospora caninum Liverpool]
MDASRRLFGGWSSPSRFRRLSALCSLLLFLCLLPPHPFRYHSGHSFSREHCALTAIAAELRGAAPPPSPETKEPTDATNENKADGSSSEQRASTEVKQPTAQEGSSSEPTAEITPAESQETHDSDTVEKEFQTDSSSARVEIGQGTRAEQAGGSAEETYQGGSTEELPPGTSQEEYTDDIYERDAIPSDAFEQWETAYDIPDQLRRRIEGDDPLYYNLVIEERFYLMEPPFGVRAGHTQEESEEGGQLLREEDTHTASGDVPAQKNGVYAMCYARTEDEIWQRCAEASDAAEGVYIQMHEMLDFGRLVDPDEADPSTVTAALADDHYRRSIRDLGVSWFATIKEMKASTGLKVAGIWFGPPDFDKIDSILKENPGVFEGVYVDWEDGVGACVDKLERPPRTTAAGEPTAWAENPGFFFRYYMGGQDANTCVLEDMSPYSFDSYVRADREMKVPEEWVPNFPCFAGHQGRCYRAFRASIADSCDATQQRFMFAPYERTSDKLLAMFKEGCRAVGYEVPPHDLVQYV